MLTTSKTELDSSLQDLKSSQLRWNQTNLSQRIEFLSLCADATLAASANLIKDACSAKGIPESSPIVAEEWFAGPVSLMRNMRLLRESLENLRDLGHTGITTKNLRQRADGQVIARVFPNGFQDKILYQGFSAEVWQNPDQTPQAALANLAWAYRDPKPKVATALVLGAGNVFSIGPLDVIYKLFAENQVCLLKMNPVNAYTGPHVVKCLQPLFDAGFVKIAYGGADVGAYLVQHELVETIHITGSDTVHDAIVWGPPAEQALNKANHTPKTKKPVTSELGCVTPVIVTPGEWSEVELDFQAQNVATMVANNASFNCNAAKLIVTSANWNQRDSFLHKIEAILAKIPQRQTYYPGSEKKYADFLAAHPEAKALGEKSTAGYLPWTTIFPVNPTQDDLVFKREAWCGIIAETGLPATSAADFLEAAVTFCNERVWGTLSASLLVDPRTAKSLGDQLENAIARLRYGSVVVNHWAALSYAFGQTPWGAFPGHTLENVGSGIGWVHNAFLFKNPQKSVIYGPFSSKPLPPWFVTHRNSAAVALKILKWEHSPSLGKIPGIALAALKS